MLFGLFGGAKPTPLTAFCKKMSDLNDLLRVANNLAVNRDAEFAGLNKRAVLLNFMVMGAAGDLVTHLDRGLDGNSSQRVLGNTNLDVITAEAAVWIHFLMISFWKADQKKSLELKVDDSTFIEALQFCLQTIGEQTGFDFKETMIERETLYFEAIKESEGSDLLQRTLGSEHIPEGFRNVYRNVSFSFEPFATIVFRSIGRQSLAEPLKTVETPPLTLDWSLLTTQVAIFFVSMPLPFYEQFKDFMKAWPKA